MDSSNHGRAAPPKESSSSDHQRSSSNTDSSPPTQPVSSPPPQPVAPPHTMHYPPRGTAGYPGHGNYPPPYPPYPPPPGYPPYPNEYSHYNNNYHPGAPYYGAPQPYHSGGGGGGRGFVRGFIMCSCIIFTGFFIATLVTALLLHPELPVYKVSFLSVSNFNTTPVLSGDWNVSVTVQNPNDRLRSYFSDFKVDLVHVKDMVAVSYVPDFVLDKHEQKQMDVRATSSNGANGVSFQRWDLDAMATEKESGSLTFTLRMSSMAAFKSSSVSTKNTLLVANCVGLKVVFQNNTGNGALDNGGKPINCQLYM